MEKAKKVLKLHPDDERVTAACRGTIVSFEAELTAARLRKRCVELPCTPFLLSNFVPDRSLTRSLRTLLLFHHRAFVNGHTSVQVKLKNSEKGLVDSGKRLEHLRELSGTVPFGADIASSFVRSAPAASFVDDDELPDPETYVPTRSLSVAETDFNQYRSMLLAGTLITHYEKGTPQSRHLMLSSDKRALIIKRKKRVIVRDQPIARPLPTVLLMFLFACLFAIF